MALSTWHSHESSLENVCPYDVHIYASLVYIPRSLCCEGLSADDCSCIADVAFVDWVASR